MSSRSRKLNEVRRYGWLRDYHHEYDHGDARTTEHPPQPTTPASAQPSPVNVTVNINLGDILKQIATGSKSAKEALEEIVEERRDRRRLNEDL